MWRKRALPLLGVVTLTLVVIGQVHAAPVTMSFSGYYGQTRVFEGNLNDLGLGVVTGVTITGGNTGGADGVFSGFDTDFVVLDKDGDFSTKGDQILPFQTGTMTVTEGTIRSASLSAYQPTTAHPGKLFGLNADGSVDFATATIGTRDAFFRTVPLSLDVDHSSGWVTLGDGGSLTAAFPDTVTGTGLWLFIGEVGPNTTEGMHATVELKGLPSVPAPGAVLLASLGAVVVSALRRRNVL